MPAKTEVVEYETVVVGAAYLVKGMLRRLGFTAAVDEALAFQPEIEAAYGALAQVVVVNRLTFQLAPLYHMADWAAEHGMAQGSGIQAAWLDDDRLGAMLEALADRQVTIWRKLVGNAIRRCGVDLAYLHADTTSVYLEGAYETEDGQPQGGWGYMRQLKDQRPSPLSPAFAGAGAEAGAGMTRLPGLDVRPRSVARPVLPLKLTHMGWGGIGTGCKTPSLHPSVSMVLCCCAPTCRSNV